MRSRQALGRVEYATASRGGPLMSMRDIAEMAGVRRPVVTMWRRRHPDFPPLADGDAAHPLFDPGLVAEWLVATERAERSQIEPDLGLYTLANLGYDMPAADLVALTTSLICLRHLDGDEPLADGTDQVASSILHRAAATDPGDELLLSELRTMLPEAAELAGAVDDLVEAAWGCRAAFERIMAARHRLGAASLFTSAVTPELARLIAKISTAPERARLSGSLVVTDPVTGPGDLLTAVIDVLGEDSEPCCLGAEPDQYLARLTRRRLAVHGLPLADMDIRVGDLLPDEAGEPDVIVAQVPYVAGEDRSAIEVLGIIDDVALRLRPGCSAVVLGPADVMSGELTPYSAAERARAELLKDGMVESVIRLPGGLVPFRPGYDTALWTMASARESPWRGRVLIVDVSDRELTSDVADAVAEDVVMWRRDGYDPRAHTRAFGVQVLVRDLIDPPRPMIARQLRNIRTAEQDAADQLARVLSLENGLERAIAAATSATSPLHTLVRADVHAPPAVVSVGKLAREHRLSILGGTRLEPDDVSGDGHYAVVGPQEVLGLRRRGERLIDRMVFARRYPRARPTEPGDILVTTVPAFSVSVDRDGFAVAEFPVRVLRLARTSQAGLTPRVLTALLAAGAHGTRPSGAVRAALRLEDHVIPHLAPDELARLDSLLTELDLRRDRARMELDMLGDLARITVTGLTNGTLTLAGDVTGSRGGEALCRPGRRTTRPPCPVCRPWRSLATRSGGPRTSCGAPWTPLSTRISSWAWSS